MSDKQRMLKRFAGSPVRALDQLGDQLSFYGKAYGWTFKTISRYKREVLRQLGGITFGTGALALVRTWLAAGAAGGGMPLRTLGYEPVAEWITGMAVATSASPRPRG